MMAESEAVYPYVNECGELLFEVVRYPNKEFSQRRPDGHGGHVWNLDAVRRVPFHLPELVAAVTAGQTIYVVEGEEDVLAIECAGGVATCNPGGAGKWRDEFSEFLLGANLVVVQDRDPAGRRHAASVVASLRPFCKEVRLVEALYGNDARDHLDAGRTREDFVPVAESPASGLDPLDESAAGRAADELEPQPFDPDMLVPVGDIIPPELEGLLYIDEGVLISRGTATQVVGPEAVGKTTLLQHVALSLAAERPLLGFSVVGARVLYVGADRPRSQSDSISKLRDQYPDVGERLFTYLQVPGDLLGDPSTLLSMARAVNAEVVIIDSLYAIAPTDQSMNDDMWARSLARATATLTTAGHTLIVAAHPPRNTTDRPKVSNALGSRFQSTGMDAVINLSGKGTVTLSMDKAFGGVEPFQFVIDGETRELRRIGRAVDPEAALVAFAIGDGITKRFLAEAMGWNPEDRSDQKRAETVLAGLVDAGRVELVHEGRAGGAGGGQQKTWARLN
jgi:AAA domain-containing protein